jgi:hypothetical protein
MAAPVPALTVLRIGLDPSFQTVVDHAAWMVVPGAKCATYPSLAAALAAPARPPEILALCEPDAALLASAHAAIDEKGLPRWEVLLFGPPPAGDIVEMSLPRTEWHAPIVALAMRASLVQLALRRDNAQLRAQLASLDELAGIDPEAPPAA